MSDTDLVMYRGDDRAFTITLTGLADITGADCRFTAKRKVTDPDSDAIISLVTPTEVEILSATQVRVNVPAASTADLTAQTRLFWDLQITLDGDTRTIPDPSLERDALGTLLIRMDVSRAAP